MDFGASVGSEEKRVVLSVLLRRHYIQFNIVKDMFLEGRRREFLDNRITGCTRVRVNRENGTEEDERESK